MTPWKSVLAAAGIVVVLLFAPATALPRMSDSDTTPPVLVALSLSPASIDVTNGSATVTATATITDDLSGVDASGSTQMGIESPSNGQISAGPFTRVSGDTYTATLTVPQYAESGTWHLRYATLRDLAGNTKSMFEGDLSSAGFTATVQVSSTPDTTPPTLGALSLSPASVDVTNGPATVNVQATITDDMSGVRDSNTQMGIESAPDAQIVATPLVHSSGSTYTGALIIPQGAAAGTWHLRYVTLVDNAGNHRFIFRDELASLGFTAAVSVTSANADTTPPELHSLTISPTSVDVGSAPAVITATAVITDDRSGVAESCGCAGNQIALENSDSGQIAIATFSHATGDTWVAMLTIPQGAASGTWQLRLISLRDNAGNSRSYFSADLAALGFAPQISVTGTGQPPPSTPPYTGTASSAAPSTGTGLGKAGEAGSVAVPASGTSGPSAEVTWPANAFASDVTVTATTATVGNAIGAFFGAAYGIKLTVLSGDDTTVTQFAAPLDLAFTGIDPTTKPAYSRDDVHWTEIPLITSKALADSQPDGYYWDGATLHILTRHATIFALFHKLSGTASLTVRSGDRIARITISASAKSVGDVRLSTRQHLIGHWHGTVSRSPKTIAVRLLASVKKGTRVRATLSLAIGSARFSTATSTIAR